MAHYAQISNEEFTAEDRQKLQSAQFELADIQCSNIKSKEYTDKYEEYIIKSRKDSLLPIQQELVDLHEELRIDPQPNTLDKIETKNKELEDESKKIDAELKVIEQELKSIENSNTEDKLKEIDDINDSIDRSLCRVLSVHPGQEEIKIIDGKEVDTTEEIELNKTIKRTSYNTQAAVHKLGGKPFRKNYAAIGMIYDPVRDAFYAEQPYASWTLDEDTATWQPPTPKPEGMNWFWKEDTQEWVNYYWQEPTSEQPFPSWTYDGVSWIPPVDYPDNPPKEPMLMWDEESKNWKET